MTHTMDWVYGVLNAASQTMKGFLAIWGLLGTIAAVVRCGIHYLRKGRRARKILRFFNRKGAITLANYPPSEDVHFSHYSALEVEARNILEALMKDAGYQTVSYDPDSEDCNAIHLGGPAANPNVNELFTKLNLDFKYCTSSLERGIYENRNLYGDSLTYSNSKQRCFVIGKKRLELENGKLDYAVLIRISRNPKKGVYHTIHILFGATDSGTLIAAKEFTHLDRRILRKYGKRRNYCIVIPIKYGVSTPSEQMDCTADLFGRE